MARYSSFDAFRPHFDALARVGYFKIVKNVLPRNKYILHTMYRVVALFFILLYNLQHVVQVYKAHHSTVMVVNTLFVLLTTINTLGKQLVFLIRSQRIDRLIAIIDGPIFASTSTYHDEVLKRNATSMARLLTLYHVAIFTCGSLWAVFPFVNRALDGVVTFTAYFPFEVQGTPAFELAVAYLSVLITFQAYGNVTMDCTIVSFYAQCTTQLQILRYNLEHLVDTDDGIVKIDTLYPYTTSNKHKDRLEYKDTGKSEHVIKKRFVNSVERYRQIVWFAKEVESIFGEAMVLQFFVMAWVICMTLYKIASLNLMSLEFVSMAVYLGCMLAQLFIYCYYGTQLQIESEMVNQAAYCGGWLSLSPGFRRQLLVMMERCGHAIAPRTAYVIPMSLETYIAVLRLSYTLFTILNRK